MQQRVERHEHLHAVGMRVGHHLRQIFQGIARSLPCTESRRTDIDSVCSSLYRGFRYFFVARRSEEAKRYITMPAVTDTFIECFVPY